MQSSALPLGYAAVPWIICDGQRLNPPLSVALHKYGVAPRGSMRRIRQGVATEAYWASTVRERNEAGADAAALECNRIYETQH